jgi:hypothetical protein
MDLESVPSLGDLLQDPHASAPGRRLACYQNVLIIFNSEDR